MPAKSGKRKAESRNVRLARQAELNIFAAQEALDLCLQHPEAAAHEIRRALKHVTAANQWIVAGILRRNYLRNPKGSGR